MRAMYRYFSFRLAFAKGSCFTADRNYVHVCAPHGVFPFGPLMWQIAAHARARRGTLVYASSASVP